MKPHHFLCLSAATVVLSSFVATAAPARAPVRGSVSFDGRWSVIIITDRGTCDRAYRYSLQIRGGQVRYAGEGSFDVYGQVAPSGAVRVTVSRGGQQADGVGRLSGAGYGAGTWRGRGSSEECSGHWTAERR